MQLIKIATRKSKLAVWQAEYVKNKLQLLYPNLQIELVKLSSEGDRRLESSLAKIGGKGLFIKEIEQALLAKDADIAVHSMKDMPTKLAKEFSIDVVCKRENPFDALIAKDNLTWQQLPHGAVVGTSSLRRQSQILALRPDIKVKLLRGNVITRLEKLDQQQYDAIILAYAGLQRLNLQHRISQVFDQQEILPAVAQGAICLEIRKNDSSIAELIKPLNHGQTALKTTAERAMSNKLNASCSTPVAGFAQIKNNKLILQALVASTDGSKIIKTTKSGKSIEAEKIGCLAADDLINQGASEILAELQHS